MKKLIIILIIVGVPASQLLAQDCETKGVEKSLVKKFIKQQFGNLISPQSSSNIGNFASLDLKEAEVNFGGNIFLNNGSILGVKAKGAVTDGLMSIFDNDKLNSKLGIDVQYNFLDFKDKSIGYDNVTCKKYLTLKKKIESDYELRKIEIEKDQKKILMQLEVEKDTKRLSSLKTKLQSLKGLIKDSLDIEIAKLQQEINFKEKQLKNLPSKDALFFELDNWKATEVVKAQSELKILGFKIGWFSLGYGVTNNAFKRFDGVLAPDKQISKTSYASHSLKFQYSYYYRTPAAYESYFFTIGTAFSIQDNFSDLTRVEISETKNYGVNPNDRSITSKYNAYQGEYATGLKSISFYADFYWFLFEDNKGAFHFYPEQKVVESLKPATNLGLGFLMTFKDKEATGNILNAELYMNFLDVSDNRNSAEKLFARSSYGIRFTFPINFNSKL